MERALSAPVEQSRGVQTERLVARADARPSVSALRVERLGGRRERWREHRTSEVLLALLDAGGATLFRERRRHAQREPVVKCAALTNHIHEQ